MPHPGDLVPLFTAAEDGRIVAVNELLSNKLTFAVPGKLGTVPDLKIETGGFQTQITQLLIAPDGEFSPEEVVVLPGEEIWIIGSFASNRAILHNHPPESLFRFPEVGQH